MKLNYILGSLLVAMIAVSLPVQSAPLVNVTTPTNGATYIAPVNILLRAESSDSNGIAFTQIFAGTNWMGSAKSNVFTTTWTNVPVGTYVIHGEAENGLNVRGTSAPVTISVISNSAPMVFITATDSHASEPGEDVGTFTVSRIGDSSTNLTVLYSIVGTASNGVDYATLPGSVLIPAGSSNATIVVQPLDDAILEATESVTLTLKSNLTCRPVYPNQATLNIFDNETNNAPTVAIFNPTNGASFTLPTNILLQAEAHDVDGTIARVAFYRGADLIASVIASTATPPTFSLLWTNPFIGDFSITARAYDNFEKIATSAPVHIVITGQTVSNNLPTVSIASPTNQSKFHSPTNIEIVATAFESNGVIATVQFFANDTSLGTATNNPLSAQPANLFHVTWINPSPGNYTLSAKATDDHGGTTVSQGVAVAILSETANLPPTVSIQSPTNYSVFYGPTNLSITAQASDSDGTISGVSFYSGSQLLGSSTAAPYSLVWSNVQPGSYSLVAKAIDNQGAISSSLTNYITVKSLKEFSFVTRNVPLWYVPGVKMTVRLQASPKTNTLSYLVQDAPPAGWTINSVGENGSIDPGGASVTFGPFNDKLTRTLTYFATPPSSESGEKHFSGTGTANGITSPVLGISVIHAAPPHPADLNSSNFFIGTDELNAYALAWKHCQSWPVSPSPIPVSYLTRAGYIVGGGGTYALSTNFPTPMPPLIWVRDATVQDSTSNSLSSSVPWTTNNLGSAIASMPTNYFSNVTFTVTLAISPVASCSAYAVEDRTPEGWTVSNVSDGGFFCPILKKVKWGLFLDNQSRVLTYQITPATNLFSSAGFSGVASFDGVNVPITGKRFTYLSTGIIPPATLQSIITSPSGDRIITFLGQAGVVYQLEGSTNLSDWEPMDQLLNNDGVLYYTDPATTNFVNRFYRALPTDAN